MAKPSWAGGFVRVLDMIAAPKGPVYWLVTIVVAIALLAVHLRNKPNRDAVVDAMKRASGHKPILKPWSLCGKTIDLRDFSLKPPEYLWCYDDRYFAMFSVTAASQTVKSGRTALQHYLRPTLLWNDVVFAALLAVLTCLLLAAFIPAWIPHAWAMYLTPIMGAAALLYAAADFAEDWRIAHLLRTDIAPDPRAVRTTLMLTRTKVFMLGLSGIGMVIFGMLAALNAALSIRSGKA